MYQACCHVHPVNSFLCACNSIHRGADFAGHPYRVTGPTQSLPYCPRRDASSLWDTGQGLGLMWGGSEERTVIRGSTLLGDQRKQKRKELYPFLGTPLGALPITSYLNLKTTPGDERSCLCFTDDTRHKIQRLSKKINSYCVRYRRRIRNQLSDVKLTLYFQALEVFISSSFLLMSSFSYLMENSSKDV